MDKRIETKESLNRSYQDVDPWGFRSNKDDLIRRDKILLALSGKSFKRALDYGCGEGFISEVLPAEEIYGYDLSDVAMTRLPENVKKLDAPSGKFDLIIATGVMYDFYDGEKIFNELKELSSGIILFCNIKDWEIDSLKNIPVLEEFPYREYIEVIRIYDNSSLNKRSESPKLRKPRKTKKL